jgi:ubiquinone/menaquinone biosynthesis C-methylase UbiE
MKVRDLQHPLLPRTTSEQRSRQNAVVGLRRLLNARVRPRNIEAYDAEGEPEFVRRYGRRPQSPDEIQEAFFLSRSYRRWSAVNRAAQEMIWVSVGEPTYSDRERMSAAARELSQSKPDLGSLTLDAAYAPSPEVAGVDIHLQPGGYALDHGPDDVVAGALYECGGNVFSFGQGSGRADSKAALVFRLLEETFGVFEPKRILDLGCSAGAASAAYADRYPEADVHAVDIGAAMLRYAHARAQALDVAVHFHQMDASNLRFEDESFDLVVSHNLLHEIGEAKRRAALRESWRVVRPGGIVIHQDVAIRDLPTMVQQVEREWDTHFNGEVHWTTYAAANLKSDMLAAGCRPSEITQHDLAPVHGINRWYAISARKPADEK